MICGQLFEGQVVGFWPMKRKKKNASNDNFPYFLEYCNSLVVSAFTWRLFGCQFCELESLKKNSVYQTKSSFFFLKQIEINTTFTQQKQISTLIKKKNSAE